MTNNDSAPRPIVLVHGANHGGWCWERVAPRLEAAGHAVYAPTLTGLAERANELTPSVGLATHVDDIAQLIATENLHEVVLVGHSYAGAVISGVAEYESARIAQLIYLDAFILRDGESLLDVEPPESRKIFLDAARDQGDGWLLLAQESWLDRWGLTDPEDRRWVWANLTAMPLLASSEAARLPTDAARALPRIFIRFSDPQNPGVLPSIARVTDEGWEIMTIKTGHDAMVSAPGALADRLREIAARPG